VTDPVVIGEYTLYLGDALEILLTLPDASFARCLTDPPYGLEFMGKEWDKLDGDAWRTGGGFSQPGIGERTTPWVSFGSGDTANATCSLCGGRMRGARKCVCPVPEWHVKGKPLQAAGVDSRQAQSRKMQSWHYAWAVEVLRLLKPGAPLLAFGGTRTFHRLTCALEDAGFEIRDCLIFLYGSGFPKSLDVSKAIDKAAGTERQKVAGGGVGTDLRYGGGFTPSVHRSDIPITDAARQWSGWGTALKPAWEPIILAMKPLDGTFAENALKHGVAGLNIDGGRIEAEPWTRIGERDDMRGGNFGSGSGKKILIGDGIAHSHPSGRWPANVILSHTEDCELVGMTEGYRDAGGGRNKLWSHYRDGKESTASAEHKVIPEARELWNCTPDCPVRMLDEQSGELGESKGGWSGCGARDRGYGMKARPEVRGLGFGDSGGASRFFYAAKADRSEREEGLRGFIPCAKCKDKNSLTHIDEKGRTVNCVRNDHPTVKPLPIMEYLLRLTNMPGLAPVIDPFMGSGTTLVAAARLGIPAVGIEREERSFEIACQQVEYAVKQGRLPFVERPKAEQLRI